MDLHAKADIRFVTAVIIHGVVPAHARKRVGDIHAQDVLEEGSHHALEHIKDIFLLHK